VAEAVLLYDRDCGFCRWSAAKIVAWDRQGRIEPVALQDPRARELLPGMSEDDRMSSWHLVRDDRVVSAGAAAGPLLRLLPGGRPLAAVAEAFPAVPDRLYGWVSRHRDRLGRLLGERACAVQPGRGR
jgi:predicted DCC family thiol-disulfide oxidoreductase YuxK